MMGTWSRVICTSVVDLVWTKRFSVRGDFTYHTDELSAWSFTTTKMRSSTSIYETPRSIAARNDYVPSAELQTATLFGVLTWIVFSPICKRLKEVWFCPSPLPLLAFEVWSKITLHASMSDDLSSSCSVPDLTRSDWMKNWIGERLHYEKVECNGPNGL